MAVDIPLTLPTLQIKSMGTNLDFFSQKGKGELDMTKALCRRCRALI